MPSRTYWKILKDTERYWKSPRSAPSPEQPRVPQHDGGQRPADESWELWLGISLVFQTVLLVAATYYSTIYCQQNQNYTIWARFLKDLKENRWKKCDVEMQWFQQWLGVKRSREVFKAHLKPDLCNPARSCPGETHHGSLWGNLPQQPTSILALANFKKRPCETEINSIKSI